MCPVVLQYHERLLLRHSKKAGESPFSISMPSIRLYATITILRAIKKHLLSKGNYQDCPNCDFSILDYLQKVNRISLFVIIAIPFPDEMCYSILMRKYYKYYL